MKVLKRKKITTNSASVDEPQLVVNTLQSVTVNVKPIVRHELLEGRQYMVVPMVMLTEGVHTGSNGPLYYPSSELAKTPAVWDHKPICVYHPTMNGQAISACKPEIISRQKVGMMLNTKYEHGKAGQPGRLHSEAWLETNRLKQVDVRVLNNIEKGLMTEVSTGLFTDNEQKEGLWKSERYGAIARNYRADHLAILPDEKGACSISDGAGLLRNSDTGGQAMTKDQLVNSLITNSATSWDETDRAFLMETDEEILNKMVPVTNADKVVDSGSDNNDEVLDAASKVKGKKMGSKSGAAKNEANDLKGGGKRTKDEEDEDEDDAKDDTRNSAGPVLNSEDREALDYGKVALQRDKSRFIGTITANKGNKFTKEYLNSKDIVELQALADLAQGGASKATQNSQRFIGMGEVNDAGSEDTSSLPKLLRPTVNFRKREVVGKIG